MSRAKKNFESAGASEKRKTIIEILFPWDEPREHRRLEEFRVEYEALYGSCDLTKAYTSQLPPQEQQQMLKNRPHQYWDGIPLFGKVYVLRACESAAKNGLLDDMPDGFIQLFIEGYMKLGHNGPSYQPKP